MEVGLVQMVHQHCKFEADPCFDYLDPFSKHKCRNYSTIVEPRLTCLSHKAVTLLCLPVLLILRCSSWRSWNIEAMRSVFSVSGLPALINDIIFELKRIPHDPIGFQLRTEMRYLLPFWLSSVFTPFYNFLEHIVLDVL